MGSTPSLSLEPSVSDRPTRGLTSDEPSESPSSSPSAGPSKSPSASPSKSPSNSPSAGPSKSPSASPSESPSNSPSAGPSKSPSASPSAVPSTSPSVKPSVSQMPSQSPTVDSTVAFGVTICTSDCDNAVDILNADVTFQKGLNNILDPDIEVPVEVDEGSGTCTPGCTGRRFLFPFGTDKDMAPATSDDSEGRILTSSTTVVNIIVDMVETGESVNPTQLLKQFEDNKSDLDGPNLSVEGVVLATQSPSSFPSSEPSESPSDSPSAKPSASPSEAPSVKPSASPNETPSESPSMKPSVKPSATPSLSLEP